MAAIKGNAREAILAAARDAAMAYGYGGLNFRDLAQAVGIKAASITYHFATKALLAEAVARRYREDVARDLAAISAEAPGPIEALRRYPGIFRASLERDNRICLSSFMATGCDGLPAPVLKEVQAFADVNAAWLGERLTDAEAVRPAEAAARARAIYAAVAGAQIVARSRSDIGLFDALVETYRAAGLIPA